MLIDLPSIYACTHKRLTDINSYVCKQCRMYSFIMKSHARTIICRQSDTEQYDLYTLMTCTIHTYIYIYKYIYTQLINIIRRCAGNDLLHV